MKEFDIKNSLLFKGVDEAYVNEFLENCEVIDLAKGEFLFHQHEVGDAMYVIKSGKLQVLLEKNSKDPNAQEKKILDTIGDGTLLGELCVFGQQKRSASICALEDSKLLKILGEDFRTRIYSKDLDALLICYNITNILSKRIINTNHHLSIHP